MEVVQVMLLMIQMAMDYVTDDDYPNCASIFMILQCLYKFVDSCNECVPEVVDTDGDSVPLVMLDWCC